MRILVASWRLALAVTLIAVQAGIVAIGLFAPEVSEGYRAFFIDRTTSEWPSPATMPETSTAPVSAGVAAVMPTQL